MYNRSTEQNQVSKQNGRAVEISFALNGQEEEEYMGKPKLQLKGEEKRGIFIGSWPLNGAK